MDARRRALVAFLRLSIDRARRRESVRQRAALDAVSRELVGCIDDLATLATELGETPDETPDGEP